jgi:hypothetical protein
MYGGTDVLLHRCLTSGTGCYKWPTANPHVFILVGKCLCILCTWDRGAVGGGYRKGLDVSEEENVSNAYLNSNSGSSDAQSVATSLNIVTKRKKKLHFTLSLSYSVSSRGLVSNLQQIERTRAEICVCLESRNRMARTRRWRFKELVK